MHLTYVALHEVTWCMVVWCTQNMRLDGSSSMWHQPCQRCEHTAAVDIQKTHYKKSSHSCKITCERSESARERRIALYKSTQQQKQHTHADKALRLSYSAWICICKASKRAVSRLARSRILSDDVKISPTVQGAIAVKRASDVDTTVAITLAALCRRTVIFTIGGAIGSHANTTFPLSFTSGYCTVEESTCCLSALKYSPVRLLFLLLSVLCLV